MENIYIPHLLQLPQKTQTITLDDFIVELVTLTPLRGTVIIRHGGTFLEIIIKGEVIVNLICDRCLQQYNYRITLDVSENILLGKNLSANQKFTKEKKIISEDFSETLSSEGYFDLKVWIYEQLSLSMPLRKLCSNNCQIPEIIDKEDSTLINDCWKNLLSFKEKLSE